MDRANIRIEETLRLREGLAYLEVLVEVLVHRRAYFMTRIFLDFDTLPEKGLCLLLALAARIADPVPLQGDQEVEFLALKAVYLVQLVCFGVVEHQK